MVFTSTSTRVMNLYTAVDTLTKYLADRSASVGKPIECRDGCSACCSESAVIFFGEWVELRDTIRGLPDVVLARARVRALEVQARISDEFIAGVRKYALIRTGEVESEWLIRQIVCPLLEEDRCVIYDSRPVCCRAHMSIDRKDCRRPIAERGLSRVVVEPYLLRLLDAMNASPEVLAPVLLYDAIQAALNGVDVPPIVSLTGLRSWWR